MYLPKSNNQADEGISLKLAQYLEPLGKAPGAKLASICTLSTLQQGKFSSNLEGCVAHYPYLSLEGDPSAGAYKLWKQKKCSSQLMLLLDVAQDFFLSRIWKPVYNHDLSGKSVPMDKDKRLMDYRPRL